MIQMFTSTARRRVLVQHRLRGVLRVLIKLLLRLEIVGERQVPASGPVIIVINHIAWLDPVVALTAMPRIVIPMAKREIFGYFFIGPLVKLYGAIPVRRNEGDVQAVKLAMRVLKNRGAVLMAPEGTRSPTGQLQPAKDGAVMMALHSDAVIVPVGVTGTREITAYWRRLRRAPVRLSVGRPFRLTPPSGGRPLRRPDIAVLTRQMMERLAAQLPETSHGVYRRPLEKQFPNPICEKAP